jgi:hypothetical protein
MKKFFNNEVRDKEKDKIIQLNFDIKFEDIKDCVEDVDLNGEEIDIPEQDKQPEEEKKKKKKKNKKK